MSLFGNNSSNIGGGGRSNIFRDTEKIVSIRKIVTQVVTQVVTLKVTNEIREKMGDIQLLYDNSYCLYNEYDNLYNDVGPTIRNIFSSFVNGSEDLRILINYDNFNVLADKLYSHFNENNENLENFRNMLIDAVEGVKHCDNKIKEQEHAYLTLLYAYNSVVEAAGPTASIIETESSISVTAQIRAEIVEYISRGYQIVDDEGNLIPIDMDILAQIRTELNLN